MFHRSLLLGFLYHLSPLENCPVSVLWFPRLLCYSFLPQHFFLPLKKGSDQPRTSSEVEALCILVLASDLPLKLLFWF